MSFEYDLYLKEHIQNTGKALRWMSDNIPEVIDQQIMSIAMENAMHHDDSKNGADEYDPYDRYFYSGNRSYQVLKDFDYAWLHHIHNNPHHWQYWVLMEDDPKTGERFKALEMPKVYVYEMIADWWTFSWKQNKLDEIFSWYEDHEDKMILNRNTRKLVTDILNAIHVKLEELGKINGEGVVGEVVEHEDELNWNHSSNPIGKVTNAHETEDGLEVTVKHSEEEDAIIHNPTISERKAFWGKDKPPVPTIEHSDTEDSDEDLYGVPELKKFPMPDKKHVKSAIRFFNYVDPKHEKELAEAILEKAEEFGLDLESDISVGDENRFKKYLPKEERQS